MQRVLIGIGAAALGLALSRSAPAQAGGGEGSGPQILTAGDLVSVRSLVNGAAPQWSPDGATMTFGGALGESDLWTVSPAGGFPRSLHIDMGDIAFLQTHQAAYSPDGKWVSYLSTRTGPAEVYLRSLQDGREMQLTSLGARINSYTWSPDGQQIALAGDKFGNYSIYVVQVRSGAVTRVTTGALNDVFPVVDAGQQACRLRPARRSVGGAHCLHHRDPSSYVHPARRREGHRVLRLRRGRRIRVSRDLARRVGPSVQVAA